VTVVGSALASICFVLQPWIVVAHPSLLLQTVLLLGTVHHEMADGPVLVRALQLVMAGLRSGLAAILRLLMAARSAQATR